MNRPRVLAVPQARAYSRNSGIGRVLLSLQDAWRSQVRVREAHFRSFNLPLLRNLPYGVAGVEGSDILFLPQLTGSSALRIPPRVPSLVVVHDIGVVDCPEDRQDLGTLTYHTLKCHFLSLRFASHIVAVSHFTRERLLEHLPGLEKRVSVIPNAVDDSFFAVTCSREEAFGTVQRQVGQLLQRPLLLYVGSELPRKNLGLLLQVLKQTQATWPQAQLLKVGRAGGEKPRQQTLAAMAQLGLTEGEDVIFLQDLDDAALACAYRCADVFVSSSLYEGFGLPAAEAIAAGTPVVTTAAGSFPEIVAGAGMSVAPEVAPFTQAVLKTLGRTSKPKHHQAGSTWRQSAEQYLELMDRLIIEHAR